jgi:hypothetical protein
MSSEEPINISLENTSGDCNEKCEYSFTYSQSNCTASNNGYLLTLSYDSSQPPPALFNNYGYQVRSVSLYSPSIHNFNGSLVNGELVIYHNAVSIGKPLYVCIPIVKTGNSTKILQEIVHACRDMTQGQVRDISKYVPDYNLTSLVPTRPFFSYTDDSENNWIVFGKEASLLLSDKDADILSRTLLPQTSIICPSGPLVFYNKKGSNNSIERDVYIDCQPVECDDDGENQQKGASSYSSSSSSFDQETMNQFYFVMIGLIILLAFIAAIWSTQFLFSEKTASSTTSTTSTTSASSTTSG